MLFFDLNQPFEEGNLVEEEDVEQLAENVRATYNSNDVIFEPFKGQSFPTEEEAYLFYQRYARKHGFAVRKSRFDNNKNGGIKRRDFVCHCAGKPPLKLQDPSKGQRHRAATRCECKAHMRIALKKYFDIFLDEWHVVEFVSIHTHELLTEEEVRFLTSYRTITEEDKKRIFLLKDGGLSVTQIMRVMELEQNLAHGLLPFLPKDVHNLFSNFRKKELNKDAVELLQFCKDAKQENYKFQYSFTMDEDRRLEHIFWSPSHCFDWYQRFGDVVVFDTTYKINAYDMPFGIFVGTDNHGRTILFGCALLRNETIGAFSWLMKTFVSLMRMSPTTILTDQDPWMTRAIAQEMPSTKHAFCIWHITSKFSCWFTALLQSNYPKWCADFYALYRLESVEEFESQWLEVIQKYNMQQNKHVLGLYEIRHFWAPTYLRRYFFAGMTTTGRSESINAFIKRFTSSHMGLSRLIKQVDLAIEDVEQKQLHSNMLDKYRGSSLRTFSPLEKQAQDTLTPFAFRKFQDEFGRATQYLISKYDIGEYVVQYYQEGETQKHKVIWNGQECGCSCKNFEFWGILCRHILSVFIREGIFTIPLAYFPLRWHRNVVLPEIHEDNNEVFVLDEEIRAIDEEVADVGHIMCPPMSKTKGRPKVKRLKGGKELKEKQVKTCRLCKCQGHNYTTCPRKQFLKENQLERSQKKKKKTADAESSNPVFHFKV